MREPRALLEPLLELHAGVRDEIIAATERRQIDDLAAIDREEAGDPI